MFSTKKGDFGYIKAGRVKELLKTVVMLALSIGLYFLGLFSTGSNKNLLTFVAVLGMLPMAKFFVNFVMFVKARGCSDELHDRLVSEDATPTYYDLYFTGYTVNFQSSACFYKRKTLLFISEDEKCDTAKFEEHIETALKNAGIEGIGIKVFNDKETDKFISRIKELNELSGDESDNSFLFDNILSISL